MGRRRSGRARQRWQATWLIAVLALVLASCSGSDDSPDPTTTAGQTEAPVATPTPIPSLDVGTVVWTTSVNDDGSPGEPIEAFPRSGDVIHAVIELQHVPAGTSVTAAWSMNGAPVEGRDATVSIDDETAAGWVSFSLTWHGETFWPTGTLGITVTASDGQSTSAEIPITS